MFKTEEDLKWPTPKELIAALESGKYKKARAWLYRPTENSFCCLGVCAVEAGMSPNDLAGHQDYYELFADEIPEMHIGPPWMDGGTHDKLTELNDKSKGFGAVIKYLRRRFVENVDA